MLDMFDKKGLDVGPYTVYAYTAIEILEQAVKETQSLDPKKVAQFMRSGHVFHTALGGIAFDEKGDIKGLSFFLYQWKKEHDGRLNYVEFSE